MNLRFTITGNQDDPKGNPVPYTRTTQAGKFNARYKRYTAWKDHVQTAFALSRDVPVDVDGRRQVYDSIGGNPRGRVEATIMFGKETHADPDNIVKGILDALFNDDKHINVTTWHTCGNAEPRVEVTMEIL